MPFVQVRDIDIYYERRGSGPRLLYISGTGADLRNRPNVFDSSLAEHFDILAFDQRGLGQSSRPDIRYSMADYADDAAELLKRVGWGHCHVLGVSFGGMVAQELALRYPAKVDKLVLACTSSGGEGGHSYPFHELPDLPPDELDATCIAIVNNRHNATWQADNPELYQQLVKQRNAPGIGADEPNREIGAMRQLEARIDHNTYARLPELEMPVFICGGRYDGIAPVANLEAIGKQISQSNLEFFEGGHDFYEQDLKAFERVAAFLLS